jgi:asparagine synthase (glutamine-hydrolysing)
MTSSNRRFVMVFNGEIYNHLDLRQELRGRVPFRGRSDTETLLAAVETWGLDAALRRCNGMFSLAIWDRDRRVLELARDRVGEKPLYYGWFGDWFLFGSELKALRAHPGFRDDLDRQAVLDLLTRDYIAAPRSIYTHVAKLVPGTRLTVDPRRWGNEDHQAFWSLRDTAENGLSGHAERPDGEVLDELESTLCDSVRLRLQADVPVGIFLSGGVDSSLIAALGAAAGATVRTFTMGFAESAYDESAEAAAVAHHLGTEHTAMTVTPADAIALIPDLPHMFDEPLADPSQIPTHLVSRLAREHVTVALSGDGGDELFGGYNRYLWLPATVARLQRFPPGVRRAAGMVLEAAPPRAVDRCVGVLARPLPGLRGLRLASVKAAKLAAIMGAGDLTDVVALNSTMGRERSAAEFLGRGLRHLRPTPLESVRPVTAQPAELLMLSDMANWLPDDILAKVDRASMAVGLEARPPLLDHRLLELSLRMPLRLKVRDGRGKWSLRQLLARHVPIELWDRPKMGFAVPIGEWLRGPLRPWAEELLSEHALAADDLFAPSSIRRMWRRHLGGRHDHHLELWPLLVLQDWRRSTR